MQIYYKPPKKKYEERICSKCFQFRTCTWHHIFRRRYGKEWVWLCLPCHDWVHHNPAEARKLGLYEKQTHIMKKPKKLKCKKHVPLYDIRTDKIRCQFCRIEMKKFDFLKKAKKLEMQSKKR